MIAKLAELQRLMPGLRARLSLVGGPSGPKSINLIVELLTDLTEEQARLDARLIAVEVAVDSLIDQSFSQQQG